MAVLSALLALGRGNSVLTGSVLAQTHGTISHRLRRVQPRFGGIDLPVDGRFF
jgi:hypothetical protein